MNENKPWYQHKMVWLVIGIPLTSVVVGISVAIVAFSGADDVVKDNYYKEGKAINHRFEEDAQARSQGVSAVMNVDYDNGKMRLELVAASQPFVRFSLFHSTRQEYDLSGALAKVADAGQGKSVYEYQFGSGKIDKLNGHWYLEIKGDDGQGQNVWRLRRRVILPDDHTIALSPAVN